MVDKQIEIDQYVQSEEFFDYSNFGEPQPATRTTSMGSIMGGVLLLPQIIWYLFQLALRATA